jgi:hypothetical protein
LSVRRSTHSVKAGASESVSVMSRSNGGARMDIEKTAQLSLIKSGNALLHRLLIKQQFG